MKIHTILRSVVLSFFVAVPLVFAQAPVVAKVPVFEVISVKENKSDTKMFRSMYTPDGIRVANAPLLALIRQSYGLYNSSDDLIAGLPSWAQSGRFDIEAKVDEADAPLLHDLTRDQRGEMMRQVLEDRFKLKAHRATREMPIYELVLAKGGSKLTPAKTAEGAAKGVNRMQMGRGHIEASSTTTESLASLLTQQTGRTVVDKTGLAGTFDLKLDWTPEEPGGGAPESGSALSIFTAVQEQLGLRLQPGKGPVEGVVIDHIEPPSEN